MYGFPHHIAVLNSGLYTCKESGLSVSHISDSVNFVKERGMSKCLFSWYSLCVYILFLYLCYTLLFNWTLCINFISHLTEVCCFFRTHSPCTPTDTICFSKIFYSEAVYCFLSMSLVLSGSFWDYIDTCIYAWYFPTRACIYQMWELFSLWSWCPEFLI